MKISPNFTVDHWQALNLSHDSPKDKWESAIKIFHDRFDGRFLKFISSIENDEFAGFAVLALDCLLIETLEQFHLGEKESPLRKSGERIQNFLRRDQSGFGKVFTKEMAGTFVEKIRNGILHQAEIKGSSRIRIDTNELVRYTDDKNGLVINRKKFHKQLVQEFENYKSKLLDPSQEVLRQNFIKKMNHICQVAGETN